MSGDVQPRKRKDNKKKGKNEGDGFAASNEDLNIHIYKDGATGGNICAKIVFFFLLSALAVLIGLIIKENEGLNELESLEQESRYAQIFENWIDENPEDHSPELHEHDEDDNHEEEDGVSDESNVEESEEDQSQEVDDADVTEEEQSQEDDEEEEQEDSTQRSEEEDSLPRSDEATEESEEVPQSEEDETVDDKTEEESDEQEVDKSEQIDETADDESEKTELKHKGKSDEEDNDNEDLTSKEYIEKRLEDEQFEKEQDEVAPEKQDGDSENKESSGNVNVGEEPESESDKEDYEQSNITNEADFAIKEDIDAAQEQLHKSAAYANKMFEALLEKNPLSPRLLYGRAKALDILAEEKKSNELLKQSLSFYAQALSVPDVPDQLIIKIAERYIDRARFIGQYQKAIAAHLKLIERFPENATYLNNLAVTYLTINLVEEARSTLKKVLSKWPNDGFALVHYGFILKTADNNLEDSIHYMSQGLQTKAPGVVDGRFYFQLGDALTRLNRNDEAIKLYEEGVQQGLFKSKFQRSLYNVDRLTAKPWWESKDLPSYQKLFAALKENWQQIRHEGLAALNEKGYFRDEAENLKDTGTWKQLELFARGQKFSKNCARSPVTCGIIQNFVDASGCRRGQSKFSVMHPGTHVWPHCGPTNCRLRVHLGLKVPSNTFIRVAEETRSWTEGDIIIFDDSFEHEVWHNGTEFRLVLIVDVWHPNLTPTEKKTLSSI
ncbi:unnamed protein product [Ceutorhynchus assimilis]|uniref:Aspartyl/asparaginy/proline hydroxylase domain-containing protein n=1 Tax=Ceutorhynchus assimilis TaxID=467358 RepID=A0A9N9QQC9_9CUCU|nr:unnamed protein product [Ceutorhynchus assimilis]